MAQPSSGADGREAQRRVHAPVRPPQTSTLCPAKSMISPSHQFERELEVFRTEVAAATQFFYGYLTVHAVAADQKRVYQLRNTAPLFWNTSLGALQTAAFIALGRIFDQNSTHNVDRLFRIAQNNSPIFSKEALGLRKQGASPTPFDWLADYLANAYVPRPSDFRRLRAYVRKYRQIYEGKYRDLRHMIFAHKAVSAESDVQALFAKTSIRELQRMLVFLGSLYDALWQLFFNGLKPILRPRRYSVKRIRTSPTPTWRSGTVQETITRETEKFLLAAAGVAQQHLAADVGQHEPN